MPKDAVDVIAVEGRQSSSMSTSDTGVNPRAALTGSRIECHLVGGRMA